MKIPGTRKLEVPNIAIGNASNELFCFAIDHLASPSFEEFVAELDQHLPAFVFSQSTLQHYEDQLARGVTTQTTLERARDLLQRTRQGRESDSGEFGEFLLFLFAQHVKGAYKLVSKIQSRGSVNMTIPGRDGIFAIKDENGDFFFLLGEAKMRPDGNDGLREAQGDMNNFWVGGEIHHEMGLASANIVSELNEDNIEMFEAYFIDGTPEHENLKYKNIIFIGYSSSAFSQLLSGSTDAAAFEASVTADLDRCFTNQSSLIEACAHPSIYCFVPFESIDDARNKFAQHHSRTI